MKTVAVIPAKSLQQAKTRLAAQLSEAERAAISLEMLRSAIGAVRGAPAVQACAVVSPDEDVLNLNLGFEPLRQAGSGLNSGLELGRRWASEWGADALLIVLADLPLVQASDVAGLIDAAERQGRGIVLAPSNDGGTNALLLRPPDAIRFRFGRESAQKHAQEAERLGLPVTRVRSARLAFDVDTPADLTAYLAERGHAPILAAR